MHVIGFFLRLTFINSAGKWIIVPFAYTLQNTHFGRWPDYWILAERSFWSSFLRILSNCAGTKRCSTRAIDQKLRSPVLSAYSQL